MVLSTYEKKIILNYHLQGLLPSQILSALKGEDIVTTRQTIARFRFTSAMHALLRASAAAWICTLIDISRIAKLRARIGSIEIRGTLRYGMATDK